MTSPARACADGYASARALRRRSRGLWPNWLRKARLKWAAFAKPVIWEISEIRSSAADGLSISALAFSSRVLRTYWWKVSPPSNTTQNRTNGTTQNRTDGATQNRANGATQNRANGATQTTRQPPQQRQQTARQPMESTSYNQLEQDRQARFSGGGGGYRGGEGGARFEGRGGGGAGWRR